MYRIPDREDLYFHDGKFYIRNKTLKQIKIGFISILAMLGVMFANVTSSNISQGSIGLAESLAFVRTQEGIMQDIIVSTNKEIKKSDAIQIVMSTVKWGKQFNVDPMLLLAIQKVESGYNKHSISVAGAFGVMQVIPKWHLEKLHEARKVLGTPEVFDINTSIYLGAWVFRDCLDKFKSTMSALLCYNGSNASPNGYDSKVMAAYLDIKKRK